MSAMQMVTERDGSGMVRNVLRPAPPVAPRAGRRARPTPDPMQANEGTEVSADRLRLLLERIERLEEEKQGIADDIKDVYSEAKSTGFDVKTMKTIIALRRMDKSHRDEADMLLDTYKSALGI